MKHQGFLEYRQFLYLKISVWSCVVAIVFYTAHRNYYFQSPGNLGYGGSWPGYILGTVSALIVVWLAWLGIRKRRYNASSNTQAWLSAHVYLGCAVLVLASLHSGFELGWNSHSLAYFLLWVVVVSGIYGVVVFSRVPTLLTESMGDATLGTLMLQLQDIDELAKQLALNMPDAYNTLVLVAANETRLQGNAIENLFGLVAKDCATGRAVADIEALNQQLTTTSGKAGRELYAYMIRRSGLVERIRHTNRLMAKIRLWLLLHVPLALGLILALVGHVVSVFIYW